MNLKEGYFNAIFYLAGVIITKCQNWLKCVYIGSIDQVNGKFAGMTQRIRKGINTNMDKQTRGN